MKYKALVSDIDGTLMKQGNRETTFSLPSTKVTEAIEKAKDLIHISLATSRPYKRMLHILDHLSLSGPTVIIDGAVIIDSVSREIIYKQLLDQNAVARIVEIIKKHNVVFNAFAENLEEVTTIEGLNQPLYNIFLAEFTEEKTIAVHKELNEITNISIHKVPSFNTSLWGLNVTDAHASKQHGMLEIAKILNIYPQEIIAVGDGYNDFPLLMSAGLKVAMGNAVDDLKAIADYIAPSVDEDGLAWVIEKFVLHNNI